MNKYDDKITSLKAQLKEAKEKKAKDEARVLKRTVLRAARKAGLADLDLDPVALEQAFKEMAARLSKGASGQATKPSLTEAKPAPTQVPAAQPAAANAKPFWKG